MKLESIMVPALNRFASLYIKQERPVKDYFHYDLTAENIYEKRYQDVMEQTYDREYLATCIEQYMEKYSLTEQVVASLNKLRNEKSTVIIGGQQAGLLTGPLYTIHKIISIIHLAKQQEEELQVPVVPVFWIAGEDHDFLEINHVYAKTEEKMKKFTYSFTTEDKKMVSHLSYDQAQMKKWVDSVFKSFGEKEYTKEMLQFLHEAIDRNDTYTEFFTYIVHEMFKQHGLLLIDSADEQLRKMEKEHFHRLIDQQAEITKSVLIQQKLIESEGFNRTIEMSETAVNLFYNHEDERLLLEYDYESAQFITKGNEVQFTKEQLLGLLEKHPERFSNNVVTRPIMQELLFPTLAFIAGPGEIAYWGELKQAFELLDMKMPIITPRLNITLVDAASERNMKELDLTIEQVFDHQIPHAKKQFVSAQMDEQLSEMMTATAAQLDWEYNKIFERIEAIDKGLVQLAHKNLQIHQNQLQFLERKVEQSILHQHQVKINKYNRLEHFIYPEGSFQERMWNIFYYLNIYNFQLIDDLMNVSYTFDGKHQIIKL